MYKAMCFNHKRLQTYLPCAPLSLSTSVLIRLVLDLLLHFLPELSLAAKYWRPAQTRARSTTKTRTITIAIAATTREENYAYIHFAGFVIVINLSIWFR